MNGKSDKFFPVLKKFYLIILIITGLLVLYNYLYPKEPRLFAQCFPLSIPETPLEAKFLKQNDNNEYRKYSQKYFMQCSIMNTGDREASEVRVTIPDDILYAECTSGIAEIRYDKNFVEIKSLRSETSVKLDIWVEGFPSVAWKQVQLNAKEVSGKVDIGEIYYGFSASVASFILIIMKYPISFFMMLSSVIILAVLCMQEINKEREKRDSGVKAVSDEKKGLSSFRLIASYLCHIFYQDTIINP